MLGNPQKYLPRNNTHACIPQYPYAIPPRSNDLVMLGKTTSPFPCLCRTCEASPREITFYYFQNFLLFSLPLFLERKFLDNYFASSAFPLSLILDFKCKISYEREEKVGGREGVERGRVLIIEGGMRCNLILIIFIRAMISGQCMDLRPMQLRSKRKVTQTPTRPLRHQSSGLRLPQTRKVESRKEVPRAPRELKEPTTKG